MTLFGLGWPAPHRVVANAATRRWCRDDGRARLVPRLINAGSRMLADLPDEEFAALYSDERWADRSDQLPDRRALRREARLARRRGYALNNGRTERGVTAVGRAVRRADGRAEAAVSISLPTARYSRTTLPQLVGALAATTADIERDLAAALTPAVDR